MGVGALAHLGIAKEVTWGTAVAAADYLKMVSEGIVVNKEEIVSEAKRGVWDEPESFEGLETVEGPVTVEVQPETVGLLLMAALGAPTTTGVGPYTHTFTPTNAKFSADCALPPLTLEVHRDMEQAFQYAGCVVNQLQLQFGTDQKIMRAQATIIGKEGTLIAATTPAMETNKPFTWDELVVQAGNPLAALAGLEGVTLTINNNLVGIPTLNNTKQISAIRRNGYRVIETSFTFDARDLTEYNRFINQDKTAFDFTFTSGTNSLQIALPQVEYKAAPINVGGADRLTVAVTGKAKLDAASGYALQAVLTNGRATY